VPSWLKLLHHGATTGTNVLRHCGGVQKVIPSIADGLCRRFLGV
jgi:hypothetical protein